MWTNERLLNVIEQLIGPEIAGHPVWNLRTKTPQNEATTVPWHQGNLIPISFINRFKFDTDFHQGQSQKEERKLAQTFILASVI